jgi:hypothetical protein
MQVEVPATYRVEMDVVASRRKAFVTMTHYLVRSYFYGTLSSHSTYDEAIDVAARESAEGTLEREPSACTVVEVTESGIRPERPCETWPGASDSLPIVFAHGECWSDVYPERLRAALESLRKEGEDAFLAALEYDLTGMYR